MQKITKLLTALLISAVLLMTPLTASTAAPLLKGDINSSGNIEAADARFVLRASVGLEEPKEWLVK